MASHSAPPWGGRVAVAVTSAALVLWATSRMDAVQVPRKTAVITVPGSLSHRSATPGLPTPKSTRGPACCKAPAEPQTTETTAEKTTLAETTPPRPPPATEVSCAPPSTQPIACRNFTGGIELHPRVIAIAVDAAQGLGCQLLFLLRFFFLARKFNLIPYAELLSDRAYRSHDKSHTHNFLRYAFNPCGLSDSELAVAADRVACGTTTQQRADRPLGLVRALHDHLREANLPPHRGSLQYRPNSLEVGAELVRLHLQIRGDLREEADNFWRRSGLGDPTVACTVAIHYRGLDKVDSRWVEAARLPYEHVLKLAARLVSARNCTRVLIASDEPVFSTTAQRWWGTLSGVRVVVAPHTAVEACSRTAKCNAVHLNQQVDNYQKTREAVVGMMLLSRCTYMIKTPSLFSAFATLLNPKIHASLTHRGKYAKEYPERILPLTEEYLKSIGA